jgi:predicted permease
LGEVSVDGTVLAFASVLSVFTGLLFGVLPAWRISRVDPATALRDGTRTATAGRGQHRLQNALVVAEVALGLVLLIGSGLLIRSFMRVLQVDPGFDRRNVLTAGLDLPGSRYTSQQQVDFENRLIERLRALPGVQSASAGWPLPLSASGMSITFDIQGRPLPPGDRNSARVSIVQPDFFSTMRIPVLHGREFAVGDTSKSTPVVIVSESFARKFFPGEDPVGRRITPGLSDGTLKEVPREIVGIVGDVRARSLTKDVAPEYYLPLAQAVVLTPKIVVRTAAEPTTLIPAVRATLAEMDKNLPLYQVRTMDDLFSRSAAQPRFQALLLSTFGAMALLLSAIGLYGLLSYVVAQRTLEIGLRMALGAPRARVLGMILRRGLLLAIAGLAIGIVCSLTLTRFVTGLLFGVKSFDPLTFVAVSAVLLLVALVASVAPAYRAAHLDPINTLREQ